MKTSSFYPIVSVYDVEKTVKWYEETFRFYVRHRLSTEEAVIVTLANDSGERLDIISWPALEEGWRGIRVNVDNFDKATAFYGEKGLRPLGQKLEAESFKAVRMTGEMGEYLLIAHLT